MTPIPPAPPLFECRGLHYAYPGGFPALCGIDLAIAAGERVAFVGANGSGKSTLLHLLDGLAFADRGVLAFRGQPLSEAAFADEAFSTDFRRRVGLVFQNPDVQLFCPSVREDISFGPLQLGQDPALVEERVRALAETLEIAPLLERSPHRLSVGEKRRVSFATVLIMEPEVLLLDEPTAGLDPKTSTHLTEMLRHASARGTTIVTATHDLHMIADIADRVYVLGQDRRVAGCGTPAEVLSDTRLLQENNLVHAHAHHSRDHARYPLSGGGSGK